MTAGAVRAEACVAAVKIGQVLRASNSEQVRRAVQCVPDVCEDGNLRKQALQVANAVQKSSK